MVSTFVLKSQFGEKAKRSFGQKNTVFNNIYTQFYRTKGFSLTEFQKKYFILKTQKLEV